MANPLLFATINHIPVALGLRGTWYKPELVTTLGPSSHLGIVYWMGRWSPKLTGERFFRHRWGWYAALVWAWLAGRVCNAVFGLPKAARSFELLLIARKPG